MKNIAKNCVAFFLGTTVVTLGIWGVIVLNEYAAPSDTIQVMWGIVLMAWGILTGIGAKKLIDWVWP